MSYAITLGYRNLLYLPFHVFNHHPRNEAPNCGNHVLQNIGRRDAECGCKRLGNFHDRVDPIDCILDRYGAAFEHDRDCIWLSESEQHPALRNSVGFGKRLRPTVNRLTAYLCR